MKPQLIPKDEVIFDRSGVKVVRMVAILYEDGEWLVKVGVGGDKISDIAAIGQQLDQVRASKFFPQFRYRKYRSLSSTPTYEIPAINRHKRRIT